MLIGNLGKDPEIKSVGSGGRVAEFSLATTRTWNGPGGDRQEKTEWHRCVAWNARGPGGSGLADIIERYVRKGDRLYVEGSIEYRQWQDKEGQTKYDRDPRPRHGHAERQERRRGRRVQRRWRQSFTLLVASAFGSRQFDVERR
jgi:single-strand DNA-binding protein